MGDLSLNISDTSKFLIIIMLIAGFILAICIIEHAKRKKEEKEYLELESNVLNQIGFSNWNFVYFIDEFEKVKSRQALDKYDEIKFFKDHREKLEKAGKVIDFKNEVKTKLNNFLQNNEFKSHKQYKKIENVIASKIQEASAYRIRVNYVTYAGNHLASKTIVLSNSQIKRIIKDPSILMSKAECNKYEKEQQKEALEKKQREFYGYVNGIIDFANEKKGSLLIKGSNEILDDAIDRLYDRTVNSIKKIKTSDSDEWAVVGNYIEEIDKEIKNIVERNEKILRYYESDDFLKIKNTCEALMNTQREFNEYISTKVNAISSLFGTRVVRNETINNDEYQYIRPYKKTITPFSAEVSAAIFASAENNPLEYVVKNFYPNKEQYTEQIQKLQLLIEELETLKDAKRIIDNYKADYQQYLGDVPNYIMEEDEAGFYSRLGFANVDESALTVEYKFSYTSGGGKAKRSFSVPMTEETIVELINALENKLTMGAFTKEQRALMTVKLREQIKQRDNYTCCNCGNSTTNEPNLLLEIDHIVPVSRGGCTTEDNLQTLCWKCNRAKSNKI